LLDAGDKPEKQALARPGWSENDHDFSILDRERDPVEHLARLEFLADRVKLEFAHDLSTTERKIFCGVQGWQDEPTLHCSLPCFSSLIRLHADA
jgi:hypothetical protein